MLIGLDTGGTNIDAVLIEEGKILRTVKIQLDEKDYFFSIWSCLAKLLEKVDKRKISRINLSTTVSTNAIYEKKLAKVGLILQTGPGLKWDFADLGQDLQYVSGSIDHRGRLIKDLDLEELRTVKGKFKDNSLDALAVIGKFSTRNPAFELKIKDLFGEDFRHISMGHSLSGRLNFPRRVQTTYLNAAVNEVFQNFLLNLQRAIKREGLEAPLYMLKADGGTMALDMLPARSVETILSGPAASLMGLKALIAEDYEDACLFDIGGTTTDIFFLVAGDPLFEPLGAEIDGRKTLVRAIFSRSIPLGGDSLISIAAGSIGIGPGRSGNAVAYGGSLVTPTDALAYLGSMEVLYPQESKRALEDFATKNGFAAEDFARSVVEILIEKIHLKYRSILQEMKEKTVYTIRELLSDREIKPKYIGLIGGPAKGIAPYLERKFNLPVRYPQEHAIANAIGAALARPTREINLTADTNRGILTIPEIDLNQRIEKSFTLAEARELAKRKLKVIGSEALAFAEPEIEIVEAESFNMVNTDYSVDKNIRVRAQLKPGLLRQLENKGEKL